MRTTRRSFLTWAGAAATTTLWPGTARAMERNIVVIGAGLAGLYAARLLEQVGCRVQVLEARERVGGRIYTLDALPGSPEAGGNVFGPNYGRVLDVARDLGVPLARAPRGGETGLIIGGQVVPREAWPEHPLNTLPPALRDVTPDRLAGALLRENPLRNSTDWRSPAAREWDVPATDHFRERGLDDAALGWIDANNSYGNRLPDTSLLTLYRVGETIGRAVTLARATGQPTYHIEAGNMRLPEAMAAALARPVRLGDPVTGIRQFPDGVSVRCASGREFEGDAAICALPATAVRRLQFEPGLPAARQQAFDRVDYHKITQAHLLVDEPFWTRENQPASWWTDGPLGRIFTWPEPTEAGSWNMTVWINGDDCDRFAERAEEDAMAAIVAEVEKRVPGARDRVSPGRLIRWAEEPYSEGVWAVWRPGEATELPPLLSRPHDRIAFAGDHTAVSYTGMEGAMESADRAVLEVLRRTA